jgi:hypothetical protein
MPIIRISDAVMKALEGRVKTFGETPDSVLRRILGLTQEVQKPRQGRPPAGKIRTHKTHEFFRQPLLEVLRAAPNHTLTTKDAVRKVGELVGDQLLPGDHERLSSGEIRWENSAAWMRQILVDEGRIHTPDHAGRGQWSLTPKGLDPTNDTKN